MLRMASAFRPPLGIAFNIKNKLDRCLSRKTLYRRLPFLTWLRSYNTECLMGDMIAGFTVGLVMIPQALAYGLVAGLPPSYGLYSAFIPCFVYFLLGSTSELSIGPTAIMSLMTYQYTGQGGGDYAVLLTFMAGIIELVAGIVNLGFVINFISQPVISGFTSAAAIIIVSSQLKLMFGLRLQTKGLVNTWEKIFSNIQDIRWQDLTLGFICIVVLFLLKVRWQDLTLGFICIVVLFLLKVRWQDLTLGFICTVVLFLLKVRWQDLTLGFICTVVLFLLKDLQEVIMEFDHNTSKRW
ncbi:sodium-independent sulfate anion transporter-like [Cherax quadricarinatus]|uniref:sodium-independent sulfate anion transporter-like n=1 Tax=Cherax quadricarinatus TaxID=27406 RepID=UPI00387E2C99